MDPRLPAILTPPQQRAFRARFGCDPARLTPCLEGYWKFVLLGRERVWLFARNHLAGREMSFEAGMMGWLASVPGVPAPPLIELARERGISPYPVIVAGRLTGVPLGARLRAGRCRAEELAALADGLGAMIARWHRAGALNPPDLPALAAQRRPNRITRASWAHFVLDPARMEAALAFWQRALARHAPGEPRAALRPWLTGAAPAGWRTALQPLAELPPALVHGDIHEDQILLDPDAPDRIRGLLDWESARYRPPALEFNFNEWSKAIWIRLGPELELLRRRMWESYARRRGLAPETGEAMSLFYSLFGLLHMNWRQLEEPELADPMRRWLRDALARLAARA